MAVARGVLGSAPGSPIHSSSSLRLIPDFVRLVPENAPGYHGFMRLEGLLVDLDGTLYVGDEPVEGAREAIDRLESSGLVLRYVTNTTRKPRREVCEHLLSLGFEVEEAEIFTPARAAAGLIDG